jgi:hypothetical protein
LRAIDSAVSRRTPFAGRFLAFDDVSFGDSMTAADFELKSSGLSFGDFTLAVLLA